ncbi:MAG: hypothetical protein COB54_00390 [Alphaproteobacteria bacterium]|nr:MAG: hypothetical protein COB54_00390 [Alphaproteobacteria bacterium]
MEHMIQIPLLPGESPIDNAPSVTLDNGGLCIPQHYLRYHHNRPSVERIILDIDYSNRYPVFVCEDDSGLYLQVGIVGYDNYAPRSFQSGLKVVYGRKWRVEPQLPSSEIIQTVFLALKKAREHEVRELFRFHHRGGSTTPFSTHHDLPLMSQNADLLAARLAVGPGGESCDRIRASLDAVSYDGAKLTLIALERRREDTWIVDIEIVPGVFSQLPEIQKTGGKIVQISILLKALTLNEVYYQLMAEFLTLSDRHVDENFSYKGFIRFSRKNNILDIADLSSVLRRKPHNSPKKDFNQTFDAVNYEIDKTRVPPMYPGALSDKIRSNLARLGPLAGLLPGC